MNTTTTSKFFLMITADGSYIRSHKSAFEKAIGEKIVWEGKTYFIFSLNNSLQEGNSLITRENMKMLQGYANKFLQEAGVKKLAWMW